MKPEKFAEIANQQSDNSLDDRITSFLLKASARKIEAFLHSLHRKRSKHSGFATIALELRLLEDDLNARRRIRLGRRVLSTIGGFIHPTFPIGAALVLISVFLGITRVTIDDFGPKGATSLWGWTWFVGLIVGLFVICIGVGLSATRTVRHLCRT
jgi:hypothetical protein